MDRKRKIIVYIATSADGFIARTDGSVDWLDRPSPKGNYGMGAFYKSIDTILWGRKTCDMALDGVSGSAFDRKVKNYVFTRRPVQSATPEGVEFVNEPIKAFTRRLRGRKGKDIWMMGGAGIIASFLDEGKSSRRPWSSCTIPSVNNLLEIRHLHSKPPLPRSVSEMAICTKPLARRTLPRVRGSAVVEG
jgi:dihydrofolate reductase